MVMGVQYNPEKDQVTFESDGSITSVFTVRNYEEAKKCVIQCVDDGYAVLEVCGAFGEEKAKELFELCDGRVGIGYVVNPPEQNKIFREFFDS